MAIDIRRKLVLRTVVGGAIIASISPEANIGNVPQWIVQAPDGVVIYRIALVGPTPTVTTTSTASTSSATATTTNKYSVKTKDGGEVFYIEPVSSMLPLTWALKAKIGGSLIVNYYQDTTGKATIKAPDGTIIYRIEPLATPTTDGQVVYTIKTRDGKINFYLAQI